MIFDRAIIGGGVTGLARAVKASETDESCILFEPDTLGGVVRSKRQDGFIFELGPNVILAKEDLLTLTKTLGISDSIVEPQFEKIRQYIWFNERPERVPMAPHIFISSSLLTAAAKFNILRGVFFKKIEITEDDLSVAEFFARLFGPEVVERLIAPALGGIYGGDVNKLSARAIFPSFWKGLKEHKSLLNFMRSRKKGHKKEGTAKRIRPKTVTFKTGLQQLADAAVEYAEKHCRIEYTAITKLEKLEDHFLLKAASGEEFKARKVDIASSGSSSAEFLSELAPELSPQLAKLSYAPLVVAHASVSKDVALPPKGFGVLFPKAAKAEVVGIMFNSLLFPHMAPEDKHLLTVCIGGVGQAELCKLDDIAISELVSRELKKRLAISDFELLNINRWERAIPQYELGHYKLLEAQDKLEERLPGLSFIGVDRGGVGVPDRVSAAFKI